MSFQQQVTALLEEQKLSWPMLGENWQGLSSARLKLFEFPGFTIRVQFNPKRITSSAARVDKDSIARRKCFLCRENRPPEQNSVPFEPGYEILCNPFPIFKEHFTIAGVEHKPQVISPGFGDLLNLSLELPELTVFYNGSNCGASAPDHMHFQAGNRGFMPIEEELGELKKRYGESIPHRELLEPGKGTMITAVDDSLRRFILLESPRKDMLERAFGSIYSFMDEAVAGEEPMLNILFYYEDRWQVMIFPREKHRPWQYFADGEENILLSPASVDMGGTLITPLEKDFEKITREDIESIFSQVSLSKNRFGQLVQHLKEDLQ